jgi:hypothetical protein
MNTSKDAAEVIVRILRYSRAALRDGYRSLSSSVGCPVCSYVNLPNSGAAKNNAIIRSA